MNQLLDITAAARPSGRAGRHFDYLDMRVPNAWATIGLTMAIGLAGLLAETTGGKTYGVAYLGVIGVVAVLFPHFTVRANTRNLLLWLFPLWTLCSTAWSMDADRTSHSAALLAVSMVGVVAFGAMPHRREVSTGLFLVLFGYIGYSLLYGHTIGMGVGDTAFSGVIARKNMFGHVAAMQTLHTSE